MRVAGIILPRAVILVSRVLPFHVLEHFLSTNLSGNTVPQKYNDLSIVMFGFSRLVTILTGHLM